MPHPADFLDAHRRHWCDAELLFNDSRWANADQMYGFSAECGLKAVMKGLGMQVDPVGIPVDERSECLLQVTQGLGVCDCTPRPFAGAA